MPRFHVVLLMLASRAFGQGPPQVNVNAPFVTSPSSVVNAVLQLAGVTRRDMVYDLGCGDGRIVIAAAKLGARGVGIDINPDRIREARVNARKSGVEKLVKLEVGDVFNAD